MNYSNQSLPKEYEMGELLGIVLAMFQERVGILIGGILFAEMIPVLAFIPAVIVGVISGATMNWSNPNAADFAKLVPTMGAIGFCSLIAGLVSVALKIGWLKICLKITKGEPAPFSEFFSNFSYFPNFFATGFLMGIMVLAGFILLIVPGIYLLVKLTFAPYLVLDQNLGPVEALKQSWSMTEGYGWKIFFAGLAYLVVSIISSFIPILNMVAPTIAIGFFYLIVTTLYRAKKGDLVTPN